MTQNIDVRHWLFKHGGRGTAYRDICNLSCYKLALQGYKRFGPQQLNTTLIKLKIIVKRLHHFFIVIICRAAS